MTRTHVAAPCVPQELLALIENDGRADPQEAAAVALMLAGQRGEIIEDHKEPMTW